MGEAADVRMSTRHFDRIRNLEARGRTWAGHRCCPWQLRTAETTGGAKAGATGNKRATTGVQNPQRRQTSTKSDNSWAHVHRLTNQLWGPGLWSGGCETTTEPQRFPRLRRGRVVLARGGTSRTLLHASVHQLPATVRTEDREEVRVW
jgi:hypothetical protein